MKMLLDVACKKTLSRHNQAQTRTCLFKAIHQSNKVTSLDAKRSCPSLVFAQGFLAGSNCVCLAFFAMLSEQHPVINVDADMSDVNASLLGKHMNLSGASSTLATTEPTKQPTAKKPEEVQKPVQKPESSQSEGPMIVFKASSTVEKFMLRAEPVPALQLLHLQCKCFLLYYMSLYISSKLKWSYSFQTTNLLKQHEAVPLRELARPLTRRRLFNSPESNNETPNGLPYVHFDRCTTDPYAAYAAAGIGEFADSQPPDESQDGIEEFAHSEGAHGTFSTNVLPVPGLFVLSLHSIACSCGPHSQIKLTIQYSCNHRSQPRMLVRSCAQRTLVWMTLGL